jgi:hypothetical protein
MFNRWKQLEISCDAPHYAVARASTECGLDSPLDVRWCHMSRFLEAETQRRCSLTCRLWQRLFGRNQPKEYTCICGQPLVELTWCEFPFRDAKKDHYLLSQCRRCRTIFWDAAYPTPAWMTEGVPA